MPGWRKVTSKKERRQGEYFFLNRNEYVVKVYRGNDFIARAIFEYSARIQQRADELEQLSLQGNQPAKDAGNNTKREETNGK